MTLYETLGVAKDATPDEIRAAYRKAASKAHPDRNGGDNAAMQAINRANDILSDPQKRERYDQTGDDSNEAAKNEDRARALLIETIAGHIATDGSLLEVVRATLTDAVKRGKNGIQKAEKLVEKLKARKDKITRKKGGENLFAVILDREIANGMQAISQNKIGIETHELALEMLKDYASGEIVTVHTGGVLTIDMLDAMAEKVRRGFYR